jgi:hypothetical protein
MSPNSLKNMFYLFATILAIYPIIEIARKKIKIYYKVLLWAAIGLFIWLAFAVKSNDDADKLRADAKSDSLSRELTKANDRIEKKTDSTLQFMNALNKFNLRDSANVPVPIENYNTFVKNVDYLQVGPRH